MTGRGASRGLAVGAGAGSGIGSATAIHLALQHRTLLLVGRRTDRLAHTAATISALGNDVEVHTIGWSRRAAVRPRRQALGSQATLAPCRTVAGVVPKVREEAVWS